MNDESLLVIVGPTATAKTELAISLAERMGGEIVSADSVQVYAHFNIGSGKPSAAELSRAPHHLLDIRDPLDPLEAKVWAELAAQKIREIEERGATPIVCGGTFLWVRALVYGLADAPPGDAAIRLKHREIAEEKGRAYLHQRLAEVDAKSAARLHENDLVRVSRALEVFEIAGTPLSVIQEQHGFREPRYKVRLLAVEWEREAYEARLKARIVQMMERGWVSEVQDLRARGYGQARAMDAVGYRQVLAYVEGLEGKERTDLAPGVIAPRNEQELAEEVTRVTRVFARRQRTWLRDEEIVQVPAAALSEGTQLDACVHSLS